MKRLRVLRRWFKRRFGIARLVCLAILVGLAALRVADPFAVEELRVRTFDGFQVIEPRVKTARPVTIIDIDEKSLAKLGQWPWPRTRVADLIDKLTALGAVVIAFDIVFAEPDRLNPGCRGRHHPQSRRGCQGQAARAAEQRSNSGRFAQTLPRGAGPVRISLCARRIRQIAAGDGAGDARRGAAAVPDRFSGPAAQRPGAGAGGRGARPVHDQERARRHRAAGADDHAGAGRDHAVAEFRNAAGRLRLRHDPDQGRKGRPAERRRHGLRGPDRSQRPGLGAFRAPRSVDLRLGARCARRPRPAREDCAKAGADRHLGGRTARRQDHAGRSRDARCRNSRPGARKRADPNRAVAAQLGHRRRILHRPRARASGDRVCADVRTGHPGCGRRPVRDAC